MADTAQTLINRALLDLAVIAEGETPSAAQSSSALDKLNDLLDQWKAERLQIYQLATTTWTIVSGTGTYTVGSGGTVNVERPEFIQTVRFKDSASPTPLEFPMEKYTDDDYARIPMKTLTSPYPRAWYYNPTYPLGTLVLWPTPTLSTLTGLLYAPSAVSEFADLSTSVNLPPAYRRMIVSNLAVELAPAYLGPTGTPNPLIMRTAEESKQAVKTVNFRPRELGFEAGLLGSSRRYSFNIRTGE